MLSCAMTFDSEQGTSHTAVPSPWRRALDRVRSWRPKLTGPAPGGRRRWWSWTWRAVVIAAVLYYPIGALVIENIDDDPQFGPGSVAPGESRAVATAGS